jgi:hypothetical protein
MTPRKKATKISTPTPQKPQELEIVESPFSDEERIRAAVRMAYEGIDVLLRFGSHGDKDAEVALYGLRIKLQNVFDFLAAKRQSDYVSKGFRTSKEEDSKTPLAAYFHRRDQLWYYGCIYDGLDLLYEAAEEGSQDALEFLHQKADRFTQRVGELS